MDGTKTRNNLLSLLFYNNFYFISFYISVSSSLYHFLNKKNQEARRRGPRWRGPPAMAQMAQWVIRSWSFHYPPPVDALSCSFSSAYLSFYNYLLIFVGRGRTLVESMPLDRRFVGSNPALAATPGTSKPSLTVACSASTKLRHSVNCCGRERL